MDYCAAVPAWFPKKRLDVSALEWPDSFGPALRSERRTFTAIVAVITLLMFLS